jgi:hypothetical protein
VDPVKITGVSTSIAEAKYGETFTRVYADEEVTGLREGFPSLPQGEICHGC